MAVLTNTHMLKNIKNLREHNFKGMAAQPTVTAKELTSRKKELVRQSQIVQSVMQDCQYNLSHLLPVCNLLVQGPKKLTITVCQDGQGYCGDWRWILFILNSLIRWTSEHDNFIFSTPTFVIWYFCFPHKVCNMIPLLSQKTYKGSFLRYARFFPAGE